MSEEPQDIAMKDHDLLIATYTLQKELIRQFGEFTKTNNERQTKFTTELNEIGRNQVKLDGEIVSIKGMWSALDERIDKSESTNKWLAVAAVLGSIIAGALSVIAFIR